LIAEGVMRVSPLLLAVACAGSPGGASRLDRVPNGEWGGEHVRLTVQDAGARIEFDCAHGSLDGPLTLDGSGRFDVAGSLVGEGGPVQKDEAANARPARYRGESDGQHMSLAVTLEGGESAGTFSLTRGGRAKLVKCR
jgi:hypothetical protein